MKCAVWIYILGFSQIAAGVYFQIGEKEKKCFIEELPEDTMLTALYKSEVWDDKKNGYIQSSPGMGMHIEVKDPMNKIVLSKTYGAAGNFFFTSATSGEHEVCILSESPKWSLFAAGKIRVFLEVMIGGHTNVYAEIAEKDKMPDLFLRVQQLIDQVIQIQKEQNYQRIIENGFRETSESTNSSVLWWSLTQTCVLVLAGLWQMKHLKSFFEKKKLV